MYDDALGSQRIKPILFEIKKVSTAITTFPETTKLLVLKTYAFHAGRKLSRSSENRLFRIEI